MGEVHVKAVPVNGLAQFVQSQLAPEQLSRIDQELKDEARWFTGHLLAHEMVPLRAANRYTALAATARGEDVAAFARRAGRFGAELGLKSVYRFILAVLSIEYVLRKAPFMWTRVYDGGRMDVETPGERRARVRVTQFPADRAGCGRITGWFETIGERAGARALRCSHSACMAEGAAECVWDFKWE